MENIINSIGINNVFLIISILTIIIVIALFITVVKLIALEKKYKNFMKKIGNGKNIEEDLVEYINRVERIENQNQDIVKYCEELNQEIANCIQKIGIVRYNAFQDTGSDLSFALALLDENDNGIVLNGIYSREISNIYAKPIEQGKSKYTISEEEEEAIRKAIHSKQIHEVR